MRRPSLIGLFALSLLIPQAHAQDSGAPAFRARFHWTPLALPANPALAPGGLWGPAYPPALVAAAWLERTRVALARARALRDTAPPAPPAPRPPRRAPPRPAGLLGPYADLGMELALRFELKADRFRNLRCTQLDRQAALSNCEPGFPTITPNPEYAVRTAGVVAGRLHVNVDFDSQREFDANNNIQLWYQGLEDEILQRVEAGNVSFPVLNSRFISAAVPANNFGIQAVAQLGPLELRGIYAQQDGNVVKDRVYSVGDVTTQPLDRESRDLDYEQGRVFFAVDPLALPGFPAVDILALADAALPDSLRVGSLRVYRVRAGAAGGTGNQNIGGVRAVACGAAALSVECAAQRAGPFQWEILAEGRDYYVDPSGTWFVLASRLDQTDYLAVSYVTASGLDSIGTFPVIANPDPGAVDTLRLVYDPRTGVTADAPSFRFESRNAYRVGGGEVDRQSLALTVTVNQRERTPSGQTYLERMGMALSTDPNTFDQYNRMFPRDRDPQQGAPVRDQFVIFPHLTPFADTARLEPAERNDSLYRTPRTLLATQGPPSVFALHVRADVSASADRSVLSLNSFQIREGSEKLYLGSRLLVRGTDYTIDYATGQVQFLGADSLFQGGVAQVRAQFEERAAFAVAPTAIFGLAARYDLGQRGDVTVTGLFQNERSAFTRPPLGFEPSSSFIGGVSTRLRFQPTWLTRVVDALPVLRTDAPSFVNVAAEVAMSKPSPNRFGQAYIEEFEGEAGRFLPLDEKRWRWGSLPCGDPGLGCVEGARGATPFGISAAGFDVADAAALTWQNLPYNSDGSPIQFLPQQIDPTIRLAGQTQTAEPALWLMLKPDTVLGLANTNRNSPDFGRPNWVRPPSQAPRWRSITLGLSETGIDLSRVEFLELWVWEDHERVARNNGAALLFDFGSVFEDAVAFVPDAYSVQGGDTTYSGVRLAGRGRLDTERDSVTQAWNAALHDTGILSDRVTDGILNLDSGESRDTLALCNASEHGLLISFAFGDLRSRCGRGNGAVDGEDLDGDFLLDSLSGARLREDFVRYVFPVGDERYFVRDGGMVPVRSPQGALLGTAGWRLYRIPFRSDTIQVGQPNLRQVQAVRLTFVAPQTTAPGEPDPQVFLGLARVRLVGSSWLKRADTPIPGLGGDRGTGSGEVVASVVSTENRDLGYTPPPGVSDQAEQRDAGLQLGATQINERSLRLLARGLGVGERAEAFIRFTTAGDKNFLKYRELRAWARGRGPGWEDGDLEFYLKVGKDPNNFYLYRTPARTASWEPEVVVQFSRWLALRAAVEQAWLRGDTAQVYPGCPDTTLLPPDSSYVMCDGPYIAHIRDPGTSPPNLASVQELGAGIFRVAEGVFVDQAEVWVDDIRLSGVVDAAGFAGALDLSVTAANLADVSFSIYSRDGDFRQLGEDPSYVGDNSAVAAATVRLERFLPAGWGLAVPFTVRRTTASSTPVFLRRTDLTAAALDGLRTPESDATTYGVALRRTRRSAGRLGRWLLDPLGVSASYATGDARADLSQATSSSHGINVDYSLQPGPVRVPGLGLRVNPATIRFRSSLLGAESERRVYQVAVARPDDNLIAPARSTVSTWRNAVGLDFLPLSGVQLRMDLASLRDLRDYGDSTTAGRVIAQSRQGLLGRDVGIETQRTLTTAVSVVPTLVRWARPRVQLSSSFSMARDPNARQLAREEGDSAGGFRLPTAFSNSRRSEAGLQVDVRRLGQTAFGDSTALAKLLARISAVDLSLGRTVNSSFSRSAFTPTLGYQLGLGGLDRMRSEADRLATSASENTVVSAQTGAVLPLGLRFTTAYQRTRTESWLLRGDVQTPIRTWSRDWPSLTAAWTVSLPPGGPGRVLRGFTAQLSYRERETLSEQFGLGAVATGVTRRNVADRAVSPSLTVTWAGGVVTTFDATDTRNEQLTAGNLFRAARASRNVSVSFLVRPLARLLGLPAPVRGNGRLTANRNEVCLRSAGQDTCVPYADTRQTQAEFTLATDIPPNINAGLQMAYVLNEERQTNRKNSQLVFTAFVSFTTSVGQLR